MRLDRFTLRGQEAVQSAIEIAERNQHQSVEPEHLLLALLEQPEGIVRPLLGKLGANLQVVLNDLQAEIARQPKVQGGQQYFSPRTTQLYTAALRPPHLKAIFPVVPMADGYRDIVFSGGDINVSLIDLDEGVRMMSRVEGIAPADVQIGQRVRARVALSEGHGLVVFDLEGAKR